MATNSPGDTLSGNVLAAAGIARAITGPDLTTCGIAVAARRFTDAVRVLLFDVNTCTGRLTAGGRLSEYAIFAPLVARADLVNGVVIEALEMGCGLPLLSSA